MQMRWVQARATLRVVAEGDAGSWQGLSTAQIGTLLYFADLYAGHIEAEEQLVYPEAKKHLTSDAVQAMQIDMMQRRGVPIKSNSNAP